MDITVAPDTTLYAQTEGDRRDPAVLLVGNTVLDWDDALVTSLAGGGHFVVRYDLRDAGLSTTRDPDAPDYTLRDLVADAVAVLDALDLPDAHVAGVGVGGWITQLLALDHPERVRSLTLVGTRPTAPGRADPDLPDHDSAVMRELFGAPKPDWTDRDQVVDAMARRARLLSGGGDHDEDAAREHAGRAFDRVAPTSAAAQRSNQMATVFASLRSGRRWRERLDRVSAPTLVVHGELDPFFPVGNGHALADAIPGATLLTLPDAGTVLTPAAWQQVAGAMAGHVAAA